MEPLTIKRAELTYKIERIVMNLFLFQLKSHISIKCSDTPYFFSSLYLHRFPSLKMNGDLKKMRKE